MPRPYGSKSLAESKTWGPRLGEAEQMLIATRDTFRAYKGPARMQTVMSRQADHIDDALKVLNKLGYGSPTNQDANEAVREMSKHLLYAFKLRVPR